MSEWSRITATAAGCIDLPMPQYADLYRFLQHEYRHDRFAGRDAAWPKDGALVYSEQIARGYMDGLARNGWALISRHEAVRGHTTYFGRDLQIIDAVADGGADRNRVMGDGAVAPHPGSARQWAHSGSAGDGFVHPPSADALRAAA